MKKLIALSALLLVTSCSLLGPPPQMQNGQPAIVEKKDAALKKKVVVLKFVNKSRHGGEEMAQYATNLVTNGVLSTDEFIVVKTEEIENSEDFVNEFGEYNWPLIYKRARAYSVAGIIVGKIEDLAIRETGEEIGLFRSRKYAVVATVRIQLYDTTTEREITSQLSSADITEEHTDFFQNRNPAAFDAEKGKVAISKAITKVVPMLPAYGKKIAWTGRIAKVDFHRYYINAGELTGLRPGQLLKIYDEGQPVFDPDTNALIGMAPGKMKGLLKIISHFGQDGSVAVVHSGAGFKERDRVELFTAVQN